MISGSARFVSTEAARSLRQTRKFLRHTAIQRISVPEVAAGQLEEHVLQARRAVQIGKLGPPLEALQQGLHALGIAEHGIAHPLDPWSERFGALGPAFHPRA